MRLLNKQNSATRNNTAEVIINFGGFVLLCIVFVFMQCSLIVRAEQLHPICERFAEFQNAKIDGDTPRERSQQQMTKDVQEKQLAKQFYESYFAHPRVAAKLRECIKDYPRREIILNYVQSFLVRQLYTELCQSTQPIIQSFCQQANVYTNNGTSFMFQLTGEIFGTAPAAYQAGYNRGQNSFYIDVTRTPREEFSLMIVHELSHLMDTVRTESPLPLAEERVIAKRTATLAQSFTSIDQLTDEDRAQLLRWQQAGLEQGLLAEYRAWVITLRVYLAGREANLWPAMPRYDNIIRRQKRDAPLDEIIFQRLDLGAYDPNVDMYSHKLVRDGLMYLRREYRSRSRVIQWGRLGDILNDAGQPPQF